MLNLPFSNELTENGKYGILGNNIGDLTLRLLNAKYSTTFVNSEQVKNFARTNYNMGTVALQYIKAYRSCY